MLTVTALIVTYERPEWLSRCVRSLEQAARAENRVRLEILVCIDGVDPVSREVARLLPCRLMELDRRLLPGAARNRALGREFSGGDSGTWVLFIDDDAFVEPDYFTRFVEVAGKFPNAKVIGGPNLTPEKSGLFQRATGVALSSRFATYVSVSRYLPRGEDRISGGEELILCNLFARRDVLGDAPFPEHLLCGEENWTFADFAIRGIEMIHSPSLTLRHERRGRAEELAEQVYEYGVGRGRNIRHSPLGSRLAHVLPSLCIFYGLCITLATALGRGRAELFLPIVAYPFFAAFSAVRATLVAGETAWVGIISVFIFPLIHLFYGIGVLRGVAWDD